MANEDLVLEIGSGNGCRNGGCVVVVVRHSSRAELRLCGQFVWLRWDP
jgi:hypothetical protein